MSADDVEVSIETLSKEEKKRKKNKKRGSSPYYDNPTPLEPPQQPIEEPVAEDAAPEWNYWMDYHQKTYC